MDKNCKKREVKCYSRLATDPDFYVKYEMLRFSPCTGSETVRFVQMPSPFSFLFLTGMVVFFFLPAFPLPFNWFFIRPVVVGAFDRDRCANSFLRSSQSCCRKFVQRETAEPEMSGMHR